ncbi:type II secretion system protein [Pseudomonas aeruginosa]
MNRIPEGRPQQGQTLIELLFATAIVGFLMVLAAQTREADREQDRARVSGGQLYQINNAIREWVSDNNGAPSSVQTGTAWLKSTSCPGGTGTVSYLPCSFPDATTTKPLPNGRLAITSTITTTGIAPNTTTKVTTTTTPYTMGNGTVRSDLSGLAAVIAAAGPKTGVSTVGSDASYNSNYMSGIITLTAGNSGSTDAWIRTDGSNTMNATLKFNTALAATSREINNVSRIQNFAANTLTLGNPGGAGAGYSVIVDANENLYGTMTVANANNAARAINLQRGNILLSNGNINANGRLVGDNRIYAPAFYDSNNTGYRLDPDGQSVLNRLDVINSMFSPAYYDTEGGGWVMDFNGNTVVNNATQASHVIFGNLEIAFHATNYQPITFLNRVAENMPCSTPGAMAISNNNDSLASCINSVFGSIWKSTMQETNKVDFRYTRPANSPPSSMDKVSIGIYKHCVLTGQSTSQYGETYCGVGADLTGFYIMESALQTMPVAHWCKVTCLTN